VVSTIHRAVGERRRCREEADRRGCSSTKQVVDAGDRSNADARPSGLRWGRDAWLRKRPSGRRKQKRLVESVVVRQLEKADEEG